MKKTKNKTTPNKQKKTTPSAAKKVVSKKANAGTAASSKVRIVKNAKNKAVQQSIIQEKLNSGKKVVLHVGCGDKEVGSGLHEHFKNDEWEEIRLDIDPKVEPDIVASILDMSNIGDNLFDAVWSSHNIEHVFPHEAPKALSEFYRVLKIGGFMLISAPDIQEVAEYICKKGLEAPIYNSPSGPIAPIDILYGHIDSIKRGSIFMAHKGGFTANTLSQKMKAVGCLGIRVHREGVNLTAVGYKLAEKNEQNSKITIVGNDINKMMARRDEIDQEPGNWPGLNFSK